jgi:hypothetical protein
MLPTVNGEAFLTTELAYKLIGLFAYFSGQSLFAHKRQLCANSGCSLTNVMEHIAIRTENLR